VLTGDVQVPDIALPGAPDIEQNDSEQVAEDVTHTEASQQAGNDAPSPGGRSWFDGTLAPEDSHLQQTKVTLEIENDQQWFEGLQEEQEGCFSREISSIGVHDESGDALASSISSALSSRAVHLNSALKQVKTPDQNSREGNQNKSNKDRNVRFKEDRPVMMS